MSNYTVKVSSIERINHDVLRIKTDKPVGYTYIPGQATDLSINKQGWEDKQGPFTFTSTPDQPYLEFIIKVYPDHKGLTNELQTVKVNDTLKIDDTWGSIEYKGEGVFIAGGAGVTPFISILRQLEKENNIGNNKLLFANKTTKDIILKDEFEHILGQNVTHILSEEKASGYEHGFIEKHLLEKVITSDKQKIYLCGPGKMMKSIEAILNDLNVNPGRVIKEEF